MSDNPDPFKPHDDDSSSVDKIALASEHSSPHSTNSSSSSIQTIPSESSRLASAETAADLSTQHNELLLTQHDDPYTFATSNQRYLTTQFSNNEELVADQNTQQDDYRIEIKLTSEPRHSLIKDNSVFKESEPITANLSELNPKEINQQHLDQPLEIESAQHPVNEHSSEPNPNINTFIQEIEHLLTDLSEISNSLSLNELSENPLYHDLKHRLEKHITIRFHPTALTTFGEELLHYGHFVNAFIKFLIIHEKKNEPKQFLIKYLYTHFDSEVFYNRTECETNKNKLFDEINSLEHNNESELETHKQKSAIRPRNDSIYASHGSDENDNINEIKSIASKNNTGSNQYSAVIKRTNTNNTNYEQYKLPVTDYKPTKKAHIRNNQEQAVQTSEERKPTKKVQNKQGRKNFLHTKENSHREQRQQPYSTPRTKESKKSEVKSNINPTESNDLGSRYHYELRSRKNRKAQLLQVRRSARFDSKEKEKSRAVSVSAKKIKQPPGTTNIQDLSSQKDDLINIDYLKENLKEIDFKDVYLYEDFKALYQNDEQITNLLKTINLIEENQSESHVNENEHQSSQYSEFSYKNEEEPEEPEEPEEHSNTNSSYEHTKTNPNKQLNEDRNLTQNKLKLRFEFDPSQFESFKDLPLTINRVVAANINNHNIYALLELGKLSQFELGTKYAITALTNVRMARKKWIQEDYQTAKDLAGEYGDNLGYIPLNSHILKMLEEEEARLATLNKAND